MADNVARRSGWVTFAGIAALIAGGYNASAESPLSDDDTVASQAQEVLYGIDLTAWGWFWLIVGIAQLVTGVLILNRNMWGLWLGAGGACASAFITVFVMFVSPVGDRRPDARLPGPLRPADSERGVHVLTAVSVSRCSSAL